MKSLVISKPEHGIHGPSNVQTHETGLKNLARKGQGHRPGADADARAALPSAGLTGPAPSIVQRHALI
jgi:hypothetical protein